MIDPNFFLGILVGIIFTTGVFLVVPLIVTKVILRDK